MKRARPRQSNLALGQQLYSGNHLARGFVGEGYEQNILRRDAFFKQIRHPIRDGAGFSASGPGQDQTRPVAVFHHCKLFGVKRLFVIDHKKSP